MKQNTKHNKKKILLAILSITIIASMLLAGTYAWFVRTADIDITGAGELEAKAESAYIYLDVNSPATFDAFDFKFFHPYFKYDTGTFTNLLARAEVLGNWDPNAIWNGNIRKLNNMGDPPQVLRTGKFVFYPGDAMQISFDFAKVARQFKGTVDHNREVLVGIDFSEIKNTFDLAAADIAAEIDKFIAEAIAKGVDPVNVTTPEVTAGGPICTLDIIRGFDISDSATLSNVYTFPGYEGWYFIYFKAADPMVGTTQNYNTDTLPLAALLAQYKFVAEFGIVGLNRNQNHYMEIDPTLTLDFGNTPALTVTAVQAAKQPVIDVFGFDVLAEIKAIEDAKDALAKALGELSLAIQLANSKVGPYTEASWDAMFEIFEDAWKTYFGTAHPESIPLPTTLPDGKSITDVEEITAALLQAIEDLVPLVACDCVATCDQCNGYIEWCGNNGCDKPILCVHAPIICDDFCDCCDECLDCGNCECDYCDGCGECTVDNVCICCPICEEFPCTCCTCTLHSGCTGCIITACTCSDHVPCSCGGLSNEELELLATFGIDPDNPAFGGFTGGTGGKITGIEFVGGVPTLHIRSGGGNGKITSFSFVIDELDGAITVQVVYSKGSVTSWATVTGTEPNFTAEFGGMNINLTNGETLTFNIYDNGVLKATLTLTCP